MALTKVRLISLSADLFLLVLLVRKSDGSRSKRDEQITNLLCFIK